MEDRIIVLKYDSCDCIIYNDYCKTNATKEEIEEAIEYKNNVRLEVDNPCSDFELLQEYLETKGKYISYFDDIEEYWW